MSEELEVIVGNTTSTRTASRSPFDDIYEGLQFWTFVGAVGRGVGGRRLFDVQKGDTRKKCLRPFRGLSA